MMLTCLFYQIRSMFVSVPFLLSCVDPPDAPVNFTVTRAEGKTCEAFFTWQPAVPGNVTTAATDTVGLEQREGSSNQWKELGSHNYSVSASETLKPEVSYEFRAYSWNRFVGKGKETMEVKFDTTTGKHRMR